MVLLLETFPYSGGAVLEMTELSNPKFLKFIRISSLIPGAPVCLFVYLEFTPLRQVRIPSLCGKGGTNPPSSTPGNTVIAISPLSLMPGA